MQKKLTITIDEAVYEGLYRVVGPGQISRFIEDLVRPRVTKLELDADYRDMAADEEREREAQEWVDEFGGRVWFERDAYDEGPSSTSPEDPNE